MRRIVSIISCLLLTLLVGAVASPALAGENEFCWQATYGRGVGSVPPDCPPGKERIGLLCYTKCSAGMKRFGFDCHSVCPRGMRDDGLYCRAAEYGRGGGYFDTPGDRAKCGREHKQGCEKWGAMWYPKCAPGYSPFGCCICRPNVPDCTALGLGHRIDLSCAKKIVVGDPTPGVCGAGKQYDAGLCYRPCQSGYSGVGPVCWGQCPKTHPVRCGMGCATDQDACAMNTTDQVMSVLEAVANVGLAVATMGTGNVAKAAANTGVGFAKAAAKMTANVSKSTVKQTIVSMGKKLGKEVTESTAETYAQAVVQVGGTGEFDPEILAGLDPSGVSAIVVAYAKPVCVAPTPLPANAPPPATRVGVVVANPLDANPLAAPAPAGAGPAWVAVSDGSTPPNAIIGGPHRSGPSMQVCRADMGDGIHPGKVWKGKCLVGWGGQERIMPSFEVLTGDPNRVAWVAVNGGRIPQNAIIGGPHRSGPFMQVCRADMGDGIHPGKVWRGKCHVGWGGKERIMPSFEVLVQR